MNAPNNSRIHYNPETGVFTWAISAPGITAGKVAGTLTAEGYRTIKVERVRYAAHRLAWFLSHNEWPVGEIDHINGDRQDNRLCNLRVVDRAGNSQNRRRAHADSSTGLLGVAWNKHHKRFQAKITAHKVRHHLGYFDTAEAAHAAYMAAKSRLHIAGGDH